MKLKHAYKSNYITKYSNKKGTMIFNGQFIYLGYLVTYQSDGNGIIRYTLSENNSLYYRTWNSIYNYDTNKYVNYSEIQFNESLWEYTRIIPGVNREEYEIIEKAINEVIKFEGISVQKQLEYLDENYNNVAHFNSVGDSLRNYDISDEEMIVLQDDGNLKVQYLPFFDNETNVKNLIKIGGIIASLTVVGIVCVAVPGLQVFIPIVAAAMKGAAVALVSTTVLKVTSLIIEMDWTNFEDVDWNKVLRDYVQECAVDMALGAALGAVKGGIDVVSNATFKKIELNRVHKQYEYLIPEDDMYGTMEYANHIFSIEQKYIKSTEKLLSTKTKDLFIEVNKKIATKSLFKFVKEYKWEA